jgi:hypothetical protein
MQFDTVEISKAPFQFRFEPAYTTTRNYRITRQYPTYGCHFESRFYTPQKYLSHLSDVARPPRSLTKPRIKKATPPDGQKNRHI